MFFFFSLGLFLCTLYFMLDLNGLQEWIMEQWEKNYYISAVAGASNGRSLVVMSRGEVLSLSLNFYFIKFFRVSDKKIPEVWAHYKNITVTP